jgi:hypothetical protein
MLMKLRRRNDTHGHASRTGIIAARFLNLKTSTFERHLFANTDTLNLWVGSMCGPYGDYRFRGEVLDE